MAQLICITGADGTGKSTLVKSLSETLPDSHPANIWDIVEGGAIPFKSKKEIDNYLCTLTPDSRLLFLAHALMYSVDKALASKKKIILLNAYYFKYFASELALGADAKLVNRLMASFPEPAKVLYLKLDPELAAQRKQSYSRYECGLAKEPGLSVFVEFQKKALPCWDHFEQHKWIKLNSESSAETLLQQALDAIK